MQDILTTLSPAETRAIAIVGLMIRMHGGSDGEGLFTGQSRYAVLDGRLPLAAERSRSVSDFWDLTARTMRWTLGAIRYDAAVLDLIAPAGNDTEVLAVIADKAQTVIRIARMLVRRERDAVKGSAKPIDLPAKDFSSDPLSVFDDFDDPLDTVLPGAPKPEAGIGNDLFSEQAK